MEATWRVGDRVDAAQVQRRLTPNVLLRLFVPDLDRHGRALPQLELVSLLRAALTKFNGGCTVISGSPNNGRWAGSAHGETTAVVESYLPEVVGPGTRAVLRGLLFALGPRCRRLRFVEDSRATAAGWEALKRLAGTAWQDSGPPFEASQQSTQEEVRLRAG